MTAPAPPCEVFEVGDDAITLAVVIDHGRLVLVLRALADTDVVVRIPITDHDAESFTRVLAGSLRWVHPAPHCPACGRPSPRPDDVPTSDRRTTP